MDRLVSALLLLIALGGCATQPLLSDPQELALEREAVHLAEEVQAQRITKVQAADRLNVRRLQVVGANPWDDEVFGYYRHLAEERDHHRIDASQSQERMRRKLDQVRKRYHQATKPGAIPVFTNFMMKLNGLPPL